MNSSLYLHGKQHALTCLGMRKLSAEQADDLDITTGQGVAMGAAAAAPFAGLIGQQEIIHDPHLSNKGKRYKTIEALAREARAGDVLVTTKPKFSIWKQTMTPLTGTDFYHTQPIIGRRGNQGVSASSGEFFHPSHRKSTLRDLISSSGTLKDLTKDYSDYTLLRPKNVSKSQTSRIARETGARLKRDYDTLSAMRAWGHDLFVPKIPGVENLKGNTICEGNVCSTLPAQAFTDATGRNVVPGKPSKYTMPADFLRSNEYELVGAHLKTPGPSTFNRRVKPYVTRAALGAGLAAGTYAVTEKPELAAIPLGMYVGNKLGPRLLGGKKDLPSIIDFADARISNQGSYTRKEISDITRKYMKYKGIPQLIGGSLAYGGALGLKHLLEKKEQANP
jgi:hypothetical protein